MLPSVFVSYSHKDADFARQLVSDIRSCVSRVWFDEISIRPGRYWDDEIERGIRESDVLLSLLSPSLLESKICKDEFDNADRLGKPVIPLLTIQYDDEKMWFRMGRRQWIDFRSDYNAGLNKLLLGLSNFGEYAIPLSQKCIVCNIENGYGDRYCPHCKSPYLPSQLGEIFSLPLISLHKYLEFYQPRTMIPNAGIDDLMAVSIVQLAMRSFDIAIMLINRVLMLKPDYAYAWYLLALSELRGKRPHVLMRTEALKIQEHLKKTIEYDKSQSHAFLLLALLKSDYFEFKGFKVDNPNVIECVEQANLGKYNKNELRAMLGLVPITDGRLIHAIQNFAQ